MRSWCMRLGGAKTAIGPSMKMQPRSGDCTAVEAGKTKARAAVKAVLGDVVRIAAPRTKVAVDEVESTGKERVDRDRVKASSDTAQIMAKIGRSAEFCCQNGAKGKGNRGKGRPTLQQADAETERRFRERLRVHCASPDHWARDCPQNGPSQQQGKGRGRGKGQHRQVCAETSGVPPGDRDAGKNQKGKGTD